MFHSPHPILPSESWEKTLRRGDIVRFRHPLHDEQEAENRGVPCPCLVLDVLELNGRRFADLAAEVSSATSRSRGYEVSVPGGAGAPSGLSQTTVFGCRHRLRVSLGNSGFAGHGAAETPILGHLDKVALARLNAVRARIQAEADIAAFYREERRREQATWAAEARGFQERNRALADQIQNHQKGTI